MSNEKPTLWERTKEVATTYTGTFIVVMILNQLLFFGFCLNPICLVAAMPHVLLITVFVGSFINKIGNWGGRELTKKASKLTNEKLDELGCIIDIALSETQSKRNSALENIEKLKRANKEVNSNNSSPAIKDGNKYGREIELPKTKSEELKKEVKTNEFSKKIEPFKINEIKKHERVYITKSNMMSIVMTLDSRSASTEDFNSLYKSRLDSLLSHKELALLCVYKDICINPTLAYQKYRRVQKKRNDENLAFQSSAASYHSNNNCKLLNGDYHNLLIPPEIKARGNHAIATFRAFCLENRHILEKSESDFITKLSIRFFLKNPPKTITAKNSGVEVFTNVDLSLLESQIDELLFDAEKYRNSTPIISDAIKKLGYGTHTIKEAQIPETPLYIWHNTYKIPLKELMQHYFRVKFNGDLSFDGRLLDKLGFLPCQSCYKNKPILP